MSLNRCEQMILDYVMSHKEERQFWEEKVRSAGRASADDHGAAFQLDMDLWDYFRERSAVTEPFKGHAQREGLRRISMKNLAEYWLRVWLPPRKKKTRKDT